MSAVPQLRTITDALVAMLTAHVGRPVGDAQVPADVGLPYLIVYPLPTGDIYGDLESPQGMAQVPFQLTAVGERRDQLDALLDRARHAILDRVGSSFTNPIAPAGATVIDREWSGGTVLEPDLMNEVPQKVDRYTLHVQWT